MSKIPYNILLTGGAGFIGSHICSELFTRKDIYPQVLILDNLSNNTNNNYLKLCEHYNVDYQLFKIDLCNREELDNFFRSNLINVVVHLAGYKSVKKSIEEPIDYYHNNLVGTIYLLEMMQKYNVHKLIFSSSATVYGEPSHVPIDETFPVHPINPYGQTKAMIEQMLMDLNGDWQIIILRYFNPVGADATGLIGENPNGIPENLVPYLLKVASGELEKLTIFGNDYPTPDGTCIRDYIHVSDLAMAHLKAIDFLLDNKTEKNNSKWGDKCYKIINLGTGKGYSVLEMIKAFKEIGVKIPYVFGKRREGDTSEVYANPSLAKDILDWSAQRGLKEMCESAWNFKKNN